jgi:hypothetical protein
MVTKRELGVALIIIVALVATVVDRLRRGEQLRPARCGDPAAIAQVMAGDPRDLATSSWRIIRLCRDGRAHATATLTVNCYPT